MRWSSHDLERASCGMSMKLLRDMPQELWISKVQAIRVGTDVDVMFVGTILRQTGRLLYLTFS